MDLTLRSLHEYLDENSCNKDFTIDNMGKAFGMSRTLFFLEVKKLTGDNPSQMVMNYRLDKAKTMLTTSKQVAEIAHKVGFNSTAYFGKCFKDKYGVSPTQYINEDTKTNNKIFKVGIRKSMSRNIN